MARTPKSAKAKKPAEPRKTTRTLSAKERAFVMNMVAGMSQAEAYRKAGYSSRGATAGASRLAKQLHIIDAIAGMRREAEARKQVALARQSHAVSQLLAGATAGAANTPGRVDPAEMELRKSIDAEVAATIAADYVDSALVENLEIAMGRKPSKRSIIIRQKGKTKDGKPLDPIIISYEVLEHNGAVANRAIEILHERVAQREGRRPRSLDAGTLPKSARDAIAGFRKAAGLDP